MLVDIGSQPSIIQEQRRRPRSPRCHNPSPPHDYDGRSSNHTSLVGHHQRSPHPPFHPRRRHQKIHIEQVVARHFQNPFTRRIIGCIIPVYLENLPKLETYGGTGDPNKYVIHVDTFLDTTKPKVQSNENSSFSH